MKAFLVRWVCLPLAGLLLAALLLMALFRFVPVPVTSMMLLRGGPAKDKPRLRYEWTPLARISPNLALAVVAAEDQRFFQHHGFDFRAMVQAFNHNRKGRTVRGASTLTQQTAKNLFLWPARSYVRKALESGLTVMMELVWPKERILEVYMNVVEFGPGIFGAEAAGRACFGHGAGGLNREEAALLAAVLPSPGRYRVSSPTPYVQERQAWILWQMGILEDGQKIMGLMRPPRRNPHPLNPPPPADK